jgi:hypothetical protein
MAMADHRTDIKHLLKGAIGKMSFSTNQYVVVVEIKS